MTTVSRRDLLKAASTVVAGSGIAVAAGGAPQPVAAAVVRRSGPDYLPGDQLTHLLRRATWGVTPGSLAQLRRKGRAAWLDEQLHPGRIDDSACSRMVRDAYPGLSWSMREVRRRVVHDDAREYMVSVATASVMRAVWSKRQLFEVMCDFWSNHLHVTSPFNMVWYCRNDYDRNVIRANALGRFEDMLVASAKHPAMLIFLNNAESTKLAPNENYGRELLELHTVGVDGGYDESDMYDSSLIMTGFGLDDATGEFRYRATDHHTGPVSVLGFSHDNASGAGGYDVGVAYLKYLANHPATAKQLAFKLARRFVSDDPPQPLVDRLAQTYLDSATAMVPVLRELFDSPEFAASRGQKLRRPLEDVVASMRVLGLRPQVKGTSSFREMYFVCAEVGHAPYAWPLVNGYPDDAGSWLSASTTLNRWNRHLALTGGWYPRALPRPPLRDLLPKRLPRTHGAYVDALAKRLVFRELHPEHRNAILGFLEVSANTPVKRTSRAVAGAFPKVVALILDSPYHGYR